jgi:dGTPase
VVDLFERCSREPQLPAAALERKADPAGTHAQRARVVADYIAGMTDRFALDEHRRLFDEVSPLRAFGAPVETTDALLRAPPG